jgi:hypothetical protein
MPERRLTRFLFEALFLVGLAVGLGFAGVRPVVLAGVMLLGWVLAALFEWTSVRGEPHYGSGLPPRYFTPRVSLPPALPLERSLDVFPVAQVPVDGPTWIVPAGEANDWPWLREPEPFEPAEQTQVVEAPVVEVVEAATVVARIAVDEPEPKARPRPARTPARPLPSPAAGARPARHRLDPLAPQAVGRRRKRGADTSVVDVPARPERRVLPGTARRGED